jgi:hypothetical protein
MKKFIALILVSVMFVFCLVGCVDRSTHLGSTDKDGNSLTFVAEFYDNHGAQWLSVEGSHFNIAPNKVKEYYYDTDGSWVMGYSMSSVVSVDIDGHNIETCGSTVLFYDKGLEKIDIELPPTVVFDPDTGTDITVPSDVRWKDAWTIEWWWYVKDIQNEHVDSRIVIIQSQEGDPICMFMGDSVSWDVSKNLPKTTEICIDGKMIYIHRANYAIVDTSLFNQ